MRKKNSLPVQSDLKAFYSNQLNCWGQSIDLIKLKVHSCESFSQTRHKTNRDQSKFHELFDNMVIQSTIIDDNCFNAIKEKALPMEHTCLPR